MNSEDKLEALWSKVVTPALNQALRLTLKGDVSLFFRRIRIRTGCKLNSLILITKFKRRYWLPPILRYKQDIRISYTIKLSLFHVVFISLLIEISGNRFQSYLPGTVANPIMPLFHTHCLLYDEDLTWNVTVMEITDGCHQFYSKRTVHRSENSDTVIVVCYFNVVAFMWKIDLSTHSPQCYWLRSADKPFILEVLYSSQSSSNKWRIC
jgi:hypothetical protein